MQSSLRANGSPRNLSCAVLPSDPRALVLMSHAACFVSQAMIGCPSGILAFSLASRQNLMVRNNPWTNFTAFSTLPFPLLS